MQNTTMIEIINQIKIDGPKNRTLYLCGEIDDEMSILFNYQAEKMLKIDKIEDDSFPKKTIRIIVDSPGGQIFPAFSIISRINQLQELGYTIEMEGRGMVASAAFVIFVCGTKGKRFLQRHSRMMIHAVGSFDTGYSNVGDSKRQAAELESIWQRIRDVLISNTSLREDFLTKIDETSVDYYMWPEEALGLGIADKII